MQYILIPKTFNELVGPDRTIFEAMDLNDSFVMETALYAWPYKNDRHLYDLLAEQFQTEQMCIGNFTAEPYSQRFDEYVDAISNVMNRVEPHLYGFDKDPDNPVEFIQIVDVQAKVPSPYFIAELNYDH